MMCTKSLSQSLKFFVGSPLRNNLQRKPFLSRFSSFGRDSKEKEGDYEVQWMGRASWHSYDGGVFDNE